MVQVHALAVANFHDAPAGVSPPAFREVMRELASGVALVTSAFERRRAGCAVSSFASLSLSPASLLVCLNGNSSTLRCVRASGVFAVNILAGAHMPLARRFSDPQVRGPERFAEGDWGASETGAPILSDALAAIECHLERVVEHATHVILIGAAVAVYKGQGDAALVHWRSRFEALA